MPIETKRVYATVTSLGPDATTNITGTRITGPDAWQVKGAVSPRNPVSVISQPEFPRSFLLLLEAREPQK
jgi:hypothetical protein